MFKRGENASGGGGIQGAEFLPNQTKAAGKTPFTFTANKPINKVFMIWNNGSIIITNINSDGTINPTMINSFSGANGTWNNNVAGYTISGKTVTIEAFSYSGAAQSLRPIAFY